MTHQAKAYLFGLTAVLCWSTVAVAFKWGLASLSPAQLLLFSSLASTLVLGLMLGWQGKLKQIQHLNTKQWQASLFFGLLNPFIYYLVLFKAYSLLPAQEAQAINYTWALTMTLLAVPLLKHRLRTVDIIAALLCYLGVLVIATRGHLFAMQFDNTLGVLLALLSTLLWALYWILNTRDARDPVLGLFLNFLCSLPLVFAWCLVTGELKAINWQGLPIAVYIGIFEMGLTFVLWLSAMKYTASTAKISNLIFLSPFLSLIFIRLLLQESIAPSTIYGLALILSGLAMQQLWFSRKVS